MEKDQQQKVCRACSIPKLLRYFERSYNTKDALTDTLRSVCRTCRNTQQSDSVCSAKSRARLRSEVLKALGSKCSCCGETYEEFLTVDHIGNWGFSERVNRSGSRLYGAVKKSGYDKSLFRLLCWNCNCSIGVRGYCPHRPLIQYKRWREFKAAQEMIKPCV